MALCDYSLEILHTFIDKSYKNITKNCLQAKMNVILLNIFHGVFFL